MRITPFLLILVFAVNLQARTYLSVEDVPNTRLQSDSIHISDPDDWINEAYENKINVVLDSVRKISQADVFVVVLSSIDDQSIELFATDLFNHWGIGDAQRHDGLLMLMVEDQHKLKFETGYGLESILPDALCAKIFNKVIVPYFKKGEYNEGLYAGVCAVANELGYMPADSQVSSSQIAALKSQDENNDKKGSNTKNSEGVEFSDEFKTFMSWLLIGLGVLLGAAIIVKFLYDWFVFMSSKRKARRQLKNGRVPEQKANQVFEEFWSVPRVKRTLFRLGYVSALRKMEREYLDTQMACRCGHQMRLVPDPEADQYLEDGAVFEKKLGVVALHVLQCTHCKKIKLVELFSRKSVGYAYCPKCHCLTGEFVSVSIEDSPTYYSEGKGLKQYHCLRCGNDFSKSFVIPKKSASSSRSDDYSTDRDRDDDSGYSSSSSSGGGSFGGGSSGGGGYTGSW